MTSNNEINDFEGSQSPGSGGGVVGNPAPHEMEKQAAEKVASFPGSIENAAGMSGKKAADDEPSDDNDAVSGNED